MTSGRQHRDLVILLILGALAIGAALWFVPRDFYFTEFRPKGIDHDWTFRIGQFAFGLIGEGFRTYIPCGLGYVVVPIPLYALIGASFLVVCSALFWFSRLHRRHENPA